MDTAIAYTDQAADKGEAFGTAAAKNMTKPAAVVVKKAPAKVVADKSKSFYEQLLDEELKKDPNAVAELSKPLVLEQKSDDAKKPKEADKPLEE